MQLSTKTIAFIDHYRKQHSLSRAEAFDDLFYTGMEVTTRGKPLSDDFCNFTTGISCQLDRDIAQRAHESGVTPTAVVQGAINDAVACYMEMDEEEPAHAI